MMSSHHRSGSSTSFLFSIPSCFFFFFLVISVLLSLSSSSSSANALSAHSQQCLDLLDLKKGFIKLNESDYDDYTATTSLPHWHAGTDCCGWEGVSCDEASGLVVSLDLSERYMGGNIMPSLFNLTSLQTLNLAFNNFYQSAVLLSDFEKLANLTHLNLSYSGIFGHVPMGISRLTKLISLDLSTYYDLKLEKPDLVTLIRHLSNLKELYLDGVDISSSRTEWCQAISDSAPGLQALSLKFCSLSGPIDSSLSKLRNLSILHLDFINFSSEVPDFFAKFSSLTELSLHGCGLRGLFPKSVFELLNLKTLDLSSNSDLTGFLPEFPLNSSLETLNIFNTTFSGGLPNSLGNLESLISLDLSYCNFSGSIPWSIGNLSELFYLDLSHNHLSGHLPPMLAGSKMLVLYLSSNCFIGQIPSTLGHAHQLIFLHLEDNLLTGSIPMSLFMLPKLVQLYLADNKLSGQLQEFTQASSTLQYVDLGGNNLHGKLPKSLVNLFALTVLDLSSNNFDGSVVGLELFGHLQKLTYLDLSGIDMSISDRISGSSLLFPSLRALILQSCNLTAIPSFLKYRKGMGLLDLSNNRINGIIPKWIWSIGNYVRYVNLSCNLFTDIERPLPNPLTMMSMDILDLHSNMLQGQIPLLRAQFLDYSNNYFTGSIPFNISAYLLGTQFFSLANNNLIGEVPTSICDTNLKILDLSNNSLSGSIHECLLESLSNLQVLNLRRNQFRGILPGNINSSCSLVIINFYGNKLEGEIPKSLAKCEQLEFLDLGSNKLAGSFPYWLGNLPALKVLVLRENRFYGYFECPLGASVGNHTFEVLQILDISSNNFTGNLPLDCFTRMKAMMIHREGAGTIGFSYAEKMRGCKIYYPCTLYYNPTSTYYEDLVTVVAKGYKRELPMIPATTSYIDVSNNRLEGTLPEVIGDLKSLNFLNMSLNAFKGHIPQVFGNLRDLESLDLSGNQLSGEIPNSLTSLTFLSFLNLSNNNLVGRIPQGNQFNTFPNASFEGNPGLCGFPLSRQCVNSTSMEPSTDLNNASPELDMEEIWIWMFRGLGFGVGFALAIFRQLLFTKLKIWYKRRFMNR